MLRKDHPTETKTNLWGLLTFSLDGEESYHVQSERATQSVWRNENPTCAQTRSNRVIHTSPAHSTLGSREKVSVTMRSPKCARESHYNPRRHVASDRKPYQVYKSLGEPRNSNSQQAL